MKKRILNLLMIIALVGGVSVLESCKTDCEKYCDNGYCISGDCECEYGYSGRYCDVYVGGWSSSGGSSSGGSSSGGSSSGGSSSGGSSSGGSSLGQVTFYTTSDQNCGNITVQVSGYVSKTISSYYSNGISDCGASGCATYTLNPGTYTYSASCNGYTWGPASVTITSNGCLKYELY